MRVSKKTFKKPDSRVQSLDGESPFTDGVMKSMRGQLRCSRSHCKRVTGPFKSADTRSTALSSNPHTTGQVYTQAKGNAKQGALGVDETVSVIGQHDYPCPPTPKMKIRGMDNSKL